MSKRSSIESKTIRPGLLEFSYYASDRKAPTPLTAKPGRAGRKLFVAVLLIAIAATVVGVVRHVSDKPVSTQQHAAVVAQTKPAAKAAGAAAPAAKANAQPAVAASNPCAGNTLSKFILVSISQRHLWACQQATQVYDSPVVTGMEMYAADLTPPGTYHIYEKETNVVLKGSDSTGSWSDPVSYWMPWLENQYGVYGFHDATWRPNNAFGNISPDSTNASHGCVELPLATAAWLYSWAPIGTTLTIQS